MPISRNQLAKSIAPATVAAALILTTLGAAVPASAAAPTGEGARALPGTHPAWATPQADAGAVDPATPATARIYLAGRDASGLAALAKAVSDPNSAAYGQFLSSAQVQERFGATPAQVAAVTSWVTGAGLTVAGGNSHYLQVSGSTAAMAKAFGTDFRSYRTADGTHRAPARDAQLPAAVSGAVLAVSGLADAIHTNASTATSVREAEQRAAAARSAAPDKKAPATLPDVPTCSEDGYGSKTAKGAPDGYEKNEPFAPCSYVPTQLRKAYGVTDAKVSGKGARVAIIDAYGLSTMEQDANHYSALHGDQPFKSGQYSEYVTPDKWTHQDECGGADGWAGEEALDVEMVHGLAPDAQVVYVGGNSCYDEDLYDAMAKVVDEHLADVVSNSWGEIMHGTGGDIDPAVVAADNQIFQLGALTGIGFTFSSGDCGDSSPGAAATGVNCQADTNQAQADWPSASPWVTSVGGTALQLDNKAGKYAGEVSMGDKRSVLSADQKSWTPFPGNFYFGGGGGVSKDFAQPWYQQGVVPDGVAKTAADGTHSATPLRATPDIAMSGDLVAATQVGYTADGVYSEGGYGGTSVSAPETAAMFANAIQSRGGRALGFANPALYDRAGSKAFNDVNDAANHTKRGNVVDLGVVGGVLKVRLYQIGADYGLSAAKGYDTATGLGSPGKDFFKSFAVKK
ncbi:protease pro-enzyme activation domain-containing protein [Streptomyces sp. TLI_171]|uniref:S53 family peptidase n=1 Tax=Streptomyces sp. TLI_171 TaxID=1938859 RepID=UPI000C40B997|nr:S53 family peptidase [Streptomyces sp. TLI_171]RKE19441.1 pro-kumamolisin-like protein [Streptomyces sp. TLI_171]